MVYSEYIKTTPKKIDATDPKMAGITEVLKQSDMHTTPIKRWALYFPCYTDDNKTKLAGYRVEFKSLKIKSKFLDGTAYYETKSTNALYSLYGKPITNTNINTQTTVTCPSSSHKLINNFLPYMGSEVNHIFKSSEYDGQFFVLEKHNSNLSDSDDIYWAEKEEDEKRAILLLPKDTTKLLIDAKGKLTFNSTKYPPPVTDRLVEN